MKTILCPVDSSPRSYRLVQYVGDLAKDMKSKVVLVSIQPLSKKALVLAGSDETDHTHLDELHDYLSGIRHVTSVIEEESLEGNRHKKLGAMADRYDILIMAVADSSDKKGLDLTKTIDETLVPLLVIPDQFKYQKIKRLLYAYDYKNEPEPPLVQLHWLADWFVADVRFLSVFPSSISESEKANLKEAQKRILTSWKGKRVVSFRTTIYPNVPRGLEQYVSLREPNDLLVLSVNHHNMLERIWHKSVVKELLHYSRHPYLIIHK